MQPIGPLMVEHRLIERAVPLMQNELKRLEKDKTPDREFVLAIGRETVGKLLAAKDPGDIQNQLSKLIDLYPKHIEKEDKRFFVPVMDYFNDQEQKEMLEQMREFDKKLIHEKYEKVIEGLAKA